MKSPFRNLAEYDNKGPEVFFKLNEGKPLTLIKWDTGN